MLIFLYYSYSSPQLYQTHAQLFATRHHAKQRTLHHPHRPIDQLYEPLKASKRLYV